MPAPRSLSRRRALALIAATPAALAALPARAATATVVSKNFAFEPQTLTIAAGDVVQFSNVSGTHTATALDKSWDTGKMRKGDMVEVTFDQPGEYPYRCIYHRKMTGTIIVT